MLGSWKGHEEQKVEPAGAPELPGEVSFPAHTKSLLWWWDVYFNMGKESRQDEIQSRTCLGSGDYAVGVRTVLEGHVGNRDVKR